MSSAVRARRHAKIAAFREVADLPADVLDIIQRLAITSSMTIRVQLEPLLTDHSLAVSSNTIGNIRVRLFRGDDLSFGNRQRYIFARFLPVGGGMAYTTGHGFSIHIVRLERAGAVRVFAKGLFGEFSCFQGDLFEKFSCLQRHTVRVEVHDRFYLMLD